ncbi:Hypothetical protein NocV09_00802240 [Nannochloropsis oceanica]
MEVICDLTEDSPTPRIPPLNREAAASSAAIRLDNEEGKDAHDVLALNNEEDDENELFKNPFTEAGLPDRPDELPSSCEPLFARGDAASASRRRMLDAYDEHKDECSYDDGLQGSTGNKQPGRKRGGGGAGKPPKKSKEEKEVEREAAKAERAAKKEQEKQQKDWSKLVGDSQRGLYKNDEIVMVVDKRLRDTGLGKAVADTMRTGEFKAKQIFLAGPSCRCEDDEALEGARHHPGMVRWARMPRPLWDDKDVCPRHSGPHVEQLGFVVVVWEARDFCDQLGMDTRGDLRVDGPNEGAAGGVGKSRTTYQTLERVIEDIRLSPGMPAGARLVVLLQGVQAEIALRWRRKGQGSGGTGGACVTSDDYADALVWLLLSKGIEYKETKDPVETAMYLREATRALAERPFRDRATDLISATKGKAVISSGGGGGSGAGQTQNWSESDKNATAWARQLEVIPGMSDSKSLYVVKNHHRTLRSLLDVYEDPRYTQEQKINWLADKMETCPVGKAPRHFKSLSTKIYQCLMVDDPNFLINDKDSSSGVSGLGNGTKKC